MLFVGSKYAKVVTVTSLALILPDPSLKRTLLLVRLAEVTVVAAPVIESSLLLSNAVSCVWTFELTPDKSANSATVTTDESISPPLFVTTARLVIVFDPI